MNITWNDIAIITAVLGTLIAAGLLVVTDTSKEKITVFMTLIVILAVVFVIVGRVKDKDKDKKNK